MILYIVATPIGNLRDISQRALEVFKEVGLILAEDTRRAQKLLAFFEIKKPLLSYHQHSKSKRLNEIKELLVKDRKLALVCNAGTPGISDPGAKLIEYLVKEIPEIKIIPIPGPSALTAALSVCGFPANQFLFFGFPPTKRKRKKFFQESLSYPKTIALFESPYRIVKTLKDIKDEIRVQKQHREIFLTKEISKRFEKSWRGDIEEVINGLKKDKIQGEFVIVLGPII